MFVLAEEIAEFSKLTLVHDLAAIMLAAGIVAIIFQCLKWPKVIGYMLAGAAMGLAPIRNYMIQNPDSIDVLANLGVIFLMFSLGLSLKIKELRKIGGIIFPAALLDIVVMTAIGYAVGRHVLHWGILPSFFLGAVICDSSTTLLKKCLDDIGDSKAPYAGVLFGVTISEDILTIGLMTLLTGLSLTGRIEAASMGLQMLKIIVFLVVVFTLGMLILPKFIDRKEMSGEEYETTLIIILGLCFFLAFIAEDMEFNLALGAFLIGAIISNLRISNRIDRETYALRSMFSTVFFVTLGLKVDLPQIWACLPKILLLTVVVVVFKTLNGTLATFLLGQKRHDALKTGIGLAQIGDFAYMVALMAINLNGDKGPYAEMYQLAVGVSFVTTLLNPFMLKAAQTRLIPFLDRKVGCLTHLDTWTEHIGRLLNRSVKKESRPRFLRYLLEPSLIALIFIAGQTLARKQALWSRLPDWISGEIDLFLWALCSLISIPLTYSAWMYIYKTLGNTKSHLVNIFIQIVTFIAFTLEISLLSISLFEDWLVSLAIAVSTVGTLAVSIQLLKASRSHFLDDLQDNLRKSRDVAGKVIGKVVETMKQPQSATDMDYSVTMIEFPIVTVPRDSVVVGMTLKALQLPGRTGGASINSIKRNGVNIQPSGTERLQAGDVLYLMVTSEEQATEAKKLINKTEMPTMQSMNVLDIADMEVSQVVLKSGDFAIGKSLRLLDLRKQTAVTVLRINDVDNPSPDLVLNQKDIIFLIGTQEQRDAAKKLLKGGGESASEPQENQP